MAPASELRPVLVYIPGGGFVVGGGSSIAFNGTYLAGVGDVVVVTMNYRLGTLGFLRYVEGGGTVPGNFGILDQISAMRWVQDNIAEFGGDPEKVTLFGESAGAMSTGLHLFSIPKSDGLFRAAMMESNVMSVPYAGPAKAAGRGAEFVERICEAAGVADDCLRTDAWLRSVSLDTVLAAQWNALPNGGMPGLLVTGMAQGMLWAPTVDVAPIVGQADQGHHPGSTPKPYAFGINRNEGFFFVPTPNDFDERRYQAALECNFGKETKDQILDYNPNGSQPYDPESYEYNPVSGMSGAAQAMARVITDYAFAAGNFNSANRAWVQMQGAGLSVHGYYFTEVSNFTYTGLQSCSPATLHVCHTDELPYVFHNLLEKDARGAFVPAKNVTRAETKLAEKMSMAWVSFARDPFAPEPSSAWEPLVSVPYGPYIQWETPISTLEDLGAVTHYEFWSAIEPTTTPDEEACRVANSA